jgi:superfamily II DNA or RNA helicase
MNEFLFERRIRMRSFKDMNIKLIYDTSTSNIVDELIVPLLARSKKYYRGVGYFSSAWLGLTFKGIQQFVLNNGRMQLLTSPQLNDEDWNAIVNGEKAKTDEVIYKSICKSINDFDTTTKKDVLNMLSWLIADGFLDIKFVVCKNIVGNYHDKIAVFEDCKGNKICLHGSLNDSLQATYNGECVSVFKSWANGQVEYLEGHFENFCELYNNKNGYFEVYDIPNMLKEELKKYQSSERPYLIENKKRETIHLPEYIKELHDYQNEAIKNLIANDWHGIFEMATGTGKTITAIEATRIYIEMNKRALIIVIVPFSHLITQWEKVLLDFGYQNIVCCYKRTKTWLPEAKRAVKNFNAKLQDVACLVTTYKTASSDDFVTMVQSVNSDAFLIADECHYIGSTIYSRVMVKNINVRLGLSATPDRWLDDEGTHKLRDYFGKIVFEYDLRTAIENKFLTPYEYHPIIVHLNTQELEEYEELSKKISRIVSINKEIEKGSAAEILLIKRASIISQAESKKETLKAILTKQVHNKCIKHTLFYCAKGESKQIIRLLADLNIKAHEFVYDVSSNKREELLLQFDRGDIQALVAIKCLDEGVDVPSTQIAYFLASTSNPREFIQRRGRILRRSKNKSKACLYDFIVMPEIQQNTLDDDMVKIYKSIISKELPRFAEFSYNSENKYEAHDTLRPYLRSMGLEYLMDLLPHEIYQVLYNIEFSKT